MAISWNSALIVVAAGLVLGLGGCNLIGPDPTQIHVASVDYRARHPITVGSERVSESINIPRSGARPSAADTTTFRRLVLDYINRGRGTLMVRTAAFDDPAMTQRRVAQVRDYLVAVGLKRNEILVKPAADIADRDAVSFGYTASTVQVPECADWSSSANNIYTNTSHRNFGCSIRRNIGLIVADPNDLIAPKPLGSRPAVRGDQVIQNYEAGEVTVSEQSQAQGELIGN